MSAAVPVSWIVRRRAEVGSRSTFSLYSLANAFTRFTASGSDEWRLLYSLRVTRTGPAALPPRRLIFSSSFRFTITDTVTGVFGGVAFTCTAFVGAAFSLPGRTTRGSAETCVDLAEGAGAAAFAGFAFRVRMLSGPLTDTDLLRGELLINDLFLVQALSRKP